MFKKFVDKEHVAGVNQVKTSVQRALKSDLIAQFPHLETIWDEIVPKKGGVKLVKCQEHIEMIANAETGEPLFFKQREAPWYPTLRLVHRYPFLCPWMQVDKGAIRFVLSGANVMCPGLTSPGARMTKLPANSVCAITAEGKQHALAIGLLKMSSEDIFSKNKGIGVDNIHFLNDGLWLMKPVK